MSHPFLRCRWEDLAAKYNISLDWDTVAKDVVLPSESAEESKALNGSASASAAAFEAVEQKLRDTKAHRRSVPDLRPCAFALDDLCFISGLMLGSFQLVLLKGSQLLMINFLPPELPHTHTEGKYCPWKSFRYQ